MQSSDTANDGATTALAMEALDEDQIIQEMKGAVIEQYYYKLPSGKIGISYAGIKQIATIQAAKGHPISVEELYIVESADGLTYQAKAKAMDLATREIRWGNAEQEHKKRKVLKDVKSGEERVEYDLVPFAYTIAGSKAQRNAMRMFIDEAVIQAGIEEWEAKGKPIPKPVPPAGASSSR